MSKMGNPLYDFDSGLTDSFSPKCLCIIIKFWSNKRQPCTQRSDRKKMKVVIFYRRSIHNPMDVPGKMTSSETINTPADISFVICGQLTPLFLPLAQILSWWKLMYLCWLWCSYSSYTSWRSGPLFFVFLNAKENSRSWFMLVRVFTDHHG